MSQSVRPVVQEPRAVGRQHGALSLLARPNTLFARRDFPRPHAEFIDVPFADDHLDRGQYFLTGAAWLLGSQALKRKLDC